MEIFYSNSIKDEIITLPEQESIHCIRVLRNRKGSMVKVSGGDGNLYQCEVIDDNPLSAKLRIVSIEGGFGKHSYFLHVAIAPTKNIERFEWFLEKATEVGIDAITPLLCDRSERKVIRQDREERVIVAAAKQSLKGAVPQLHPLTPFEEFISSTNGFEGVKLIAHCDSDNRIQITQAIKDIAPLSAIILIGPEGDFSPREIKTATDAGFIPISLGESRLRTETAAVIATTALYLATL